MGADFDFTSTCRASLASNATCSISVTFTPSASGVRTATLRVTDNSGNIAGSVQSVQLTGTGAAASVATATASYLGSDPTTQGTWTGKYGNDGQILANSTQNPPTSYAEVTPSDNSNFTFETTTTDPRALQVTNGSSSRIASVYYSASSFTLDVNLTDGNVHKVSLYLCDWNSYSRAETISILDAGTSDVLDTQSFASFSGGIWAPWTIKGHVKIVVTYTAGDNAVINGIFFDTPGTLTHPTATATASYIGSDATTQGTWTGKYGNDGQILANSTHNPPTSYAVVTPSGNSNFTFTTTTADPRALQVTSGSSSRIASVYYSATSFTFDVNLTDGNPHKVSLYLCDWNSYSRAETISILDAGTSNVLDTQSFTSFTGGVWAPWNIKGHVKIVVTYTAGDNAVVNGILFN